MTPAERAAVHRLAGAFSRLSLAAELVAQAKPGHARAALVERMEAARKLALTEFSAAQDALGRPAESASELRDIYERLITLEQLDRPFAPGPEPFVALASLSFPTLSSEVPKASPIPPPGGALNPPRLAAQTPAPSTTKPVAPGAGSGRAVSARPYVPKPGTVAAVALELAALGQVTSEEIASKAGRDITVVRATLVQMQRKGLLKYRPGAKVPPGTGRRRLPGTWVLTSADAESAPGAVDSEAELARYGVRRLAPEQAATIPRRGPVPGVHHTVADFFADKPALPPARPVTPRFA